MGGGGERIREREERERGVGDNECESVQTIKLPHSIKKGVCTCLCI